MNKNKKYKIYYNEETLRWECISSDLEEFGYSYEEDFLENCDADYMVPAFFCFRCNWMGYEKYWYIIGNVEILRWR